MEHTSAVGISTDNPRVEKIDFTTVLPLQEVRGKIQDVADISLPEGKLRISANEDGEHQTRVLVTLTCHTYEFHVRCVDFLRDELGFEGFPLRRAAPRPESQVV